MPPAASPSAPRALLWDIFCTVIDNYGDVGVCWRLAVNLAQRGQRVRLWLDDLRPLQWLAPQGCPGVEVRHWLRPLTAQHLPDAPADVLIEAFGCTLDAAVQARWAQQRATGRRGPWINLEYLSAEAFATHSHWLPSPILHGIAAGLEKRFFYPGFTPDTGGLLREPDLLPRQQVSSRPAVLRALGATPDAALPTFSLFCYEPPALPALLQQLAQQPCQLLITQGRALAAVQQALAAPAALPVHHGLCQLVPLPWLPQTGFDEMLWHCALNFVRGEDSLVRALWAGQPFIWHIYPQHDHAHHAKLLAFLDWLDAPPDLRDWHAIWNGLCTGRLPALDVPRLTRWRVCVRAARQRLLAQTDLCSQLLALAGAAHSLYPNPATSG